jgi:hypothetical protein
MRADGSSATAGTSRHAHGHLRAPREANPQADPNPEVGGSEPASKPTTRVTRSATRTVGDQQVSAQAMSMNDVASTGEAPTAFDATEPTGDPAPGNDNSPTDEPTSQPTSAALEPSATIAPSTDAPPPTVETYSAPTSQDTAPVLPTFDVTPLGSDQTSSGSDAGSSDTTAASTPPGPVEQVEPTATQDPSSPSATVASPEPTATQEPAVPVTDVANVPAEEDVATAATDDESARQRSAARGGRVLSPLQILRILMQTSGSSSAGKATAPTLLDDVNQAHAVGAASAFGTAAALAGRSPTTGAAQSEPVSLPAGLQTFLHACGQVVVAVSLSALFVAALPYLAGLVLPTLAGTHLGYRQAKAARTLRSSGIAHLAPTGPVGTVRSGALIALRPARRPQARSVAEARVRDVA